MPYKLQVLVNKQDHLSDEEFHRYWSEEHPKIWLSIDAVKRNVVTYSQFHVNQKETQALKDAGVPVGSWDGIVTMVAENMEDLMKVFQDEEYHLVVVPDENKLLKRQSSIMMIGEEKLKKVDGKVLAAHI